jgi:hypothetical protein
MAVIEGHEVAHAVRSDAGQTTLVVAEDADEIDETIVAGACEILAKALVLPHHPGVEIVFGPFRVLCPESALLDCDKRRVPLRNWPGEQHGAGAQGAQDFAGRSHIGVAMPIDPSDDDDVGPCIGDRAHRKGVGTSAEVSRRVLPHVRIGGAGGGGDDKDLPVVRQRVAQAAIEHLRMRVAPKEGNTTFLRIAFVTGAVNRHDRNARRCAFEKGGVIEIAVEAEILGDLLARIVAPVGIDVLEGARELGATCRT